MTDEATAPRHRSSPFPFIGLRKAIERAREFHDRQRNHPAPVSVAVSIWNYAAKSSGGDQTVAALKHFGLMEDAGSGNERTVQLTPLALRIIRDVRENSAERANAIREAALMPKVHRDLWEKYKLPLPAEGTVIYYLESERGGFTERSARALIAEYVDTMTFANMETADKIPEEEPADDLDAGITAANARRAAAAEEEARKGAEGRQPGRVALMEGERVVFTEEGQPRQYLKLVASGDVDDFLLEALEDFVKRQRKRLAATKAAPEQPN